MIEVMTLSTGVIAAIGTLIAALAAIRAAKVSKRSNEIAMEALPLKLPALEPLRSEENAWTITNVGTAPFFEARVSNIESTSPPAEWPKARDLHPGDSLELAGVKNALNDTVHVLVEGYELRNGKRIPRGISVSF